MNKIIPSESKEQCIVFEWANLNIWKYPQLVYLHHIPNGRKRTKVEAAILQREGVKPGVPDLFLPIAKKNYHGLYIEMKRVKGSAVSDLQQKWIDMLRKEGYCVEVCYGASMAIEVIENYLEEV